MFTPKWKNEALHLAKGARKFVHYKRDLLKPERVEEIDVAPAGFAGGGQIR